MPNVYRLLSACTLLVVICMPGTAIGKKKDAPAEARPYVETSYLIAPRQVGDFELQGSSFDPGQKFDGAGFRYALKDHQETRVDIYVYPAGRMSPTEAIESGIRDFRASMTYAAEHGTYSRLQELRDDPFPLDAADTRGSETPANDLDAQVIHAIAQAEQVTGRRLQMQLNLMPRDWPMYSNGYLFYKQLYYFKLRASAAQERISQEQFHALTDQAARTLIPALQVANIGGCKDTTIYLDKDASPEQSALALATQVSLHKGYNCHGSAEEAGIPARRADSAVVEIPFTAAEWKSR
ncbi:MAG: hypothetical protein ACN6RG_12125 [Stenotrophomonas sp.]